jgi:hypothetical protein
MQRQEYSFCFVHIHAGNMQHSRCFPASNILLVLFRGDTRLDPPQENGLALLGQRMG